MGTILNFFFLATSLFSLNINIDVSYHLKHSDVLLPPEVLPHPFSKGREHVVGVHDSVHKAVQHWRKEGCNK